jgi:hypothetical protein
MPRSDTEHSERITVCVKALEEAIYQARQAGLEVQASTLEMPNHEGIAERLRGRLVLTVRVSRVLT